MTVEMEIEDQSIDVQVNIDVPTIEISDSTIIVEVDEW